MRARLRESDKAALEDWTPYMRLNCVYDTFKVIDFKADISADALTKKLIKLGMSPINAISNCTECSKHSVLVSFLGLSYDWANEYEKNGVRWVKAKINFRYKYFNCVTQHFRCHSKGYLTDKDKAVIRDSIISNGSDLPFTVENVCLCFTESTYNLARKQIDNVGIDLVATRISETMGVANGVVKKTLGFRFDMLPGEHKYLATAGLVPAPKEG